ncbi:hypothetical protein [Nocardioides sp. CER19]|uniref:hypothetical protein n=1 Tax=Nocardioides sp. CER19 TaxID=3038538 RepID=UPI002446E0D4|nr:hypothetical protein [Nocardioides sp. CER19]MDH2413707.1 hypothetical protein [Nocardioides sp. CER19]
MGNDLDDRVTWFAATNGRVTGVIGLIAGLVIVLLGTFHTSLADVVAGLLVGLLSWMVLLRPRVGTRATDLHLRGIASTVVVPLASIESVNLRQVLAVWVDGHRFVSAAVGHTFREINRQRRGVGQVETVESNAPKYAEQVREIITERSREARRDGAPMGPARREWAWLELGALAVLVVVLVVAMVLHVGT